MLYLSLLPGIFFTQILSGYLFYLYQVLAQISPYETYPDFSVENCNTTPTSYFLSSEFVFPFHLITFKYTI